MEGIDTDVDKTKTTRDYVSLITGIRAALYMPALVAAHRDPNVSAYYENLLARGKPKMVALVAVMRRLLHALWGMLYHRQEWDGNKFYRLNQENTA
jgi:hypothetical protein